MVRLWRSMKYQVAIPHTKRTVEIPSSGDAIVLEKKADAAEIRQATTKMEIFFITF